MPDYYDTDEYEDQQRITLEKEYQDASRIFRYAVISAERIYLCNNVDLEVKGEGGTPFFHVMMEDAWVWDTYLSSRFLSRVEVYTLSDVNIEELKSDVG